MRRYVVLALAVGLLVGAAQKEDAAKRDLKRFEGTWVMVRGEQDGKMLSRETVRGARLTIRGNRHTVKVGKDTLRGTHRLDPAKRPPAIDSMDTAGPYKGKTLKGIYRFRGGEMTVCFAAPGKARPTRFTTKSGTGHILHTWKRQQK